LPRNDGVDTLLVDEEGRPWDPDKLTRMIKKVCERERIYHVDEKASGTRRKHLHDCRGTLATHLMVEGGLSDPEIADILGDLRRTSLRSASSAWTVMLMPSRLVRECVGLLQRPDHSQTPAVCKTHLRRATFIKRLWAKVEPSLGSKTLEGGSGTTE
jgi:hypothetical protein